MQATPLNIILLYLILEIIDFWEFTTLFQSRDLQSNGQTTSANCNAVLILILLILIVLINFNSQQGECCERLQLAAPRSDRRQHWTTMLREPVAHPGDRRSKCSFVAM